MGPEKNIREGAGLPELAFDRWEDLFAARGSAALEAVLGAHLATRRWFGGKARSMRSVEIADIISLPSGPPGLDPFVLLGKVNYEEGEPETYLVPLAAADPSTAGAAGEALARVRIAGKAVLLADALKDRAFCAFLFSAIAFGRSFPGRSGELRAWAGSAFGSIRGESTARLEPSLMDREQSNSSIRYGDRFILKVLRRVEAGTSLELEISRHLTERAAFPHTPPLAGAIEYRRGGDEPSTLAVLQGFVPNRGDAWVHALESLRRFLRGVLSRRAPPPAVRPTPFLALLRGGAKPGGPDLEDPSFRSAELLGRRTAEMHRAMAAGAGDPAFAPEPFDPRRRGEVHEGMVHQVDRSFRLLREKVEGLPGPASAAARSVLAGEGAIRARLRSILEGEGEFLEIRCHGDYHLGQVLWTGEDFLIIDFEGEPARPLEERRRKRPALQDVAGMLRSFHYASQGVVLGQAPELSIPDADRPLAEAWARLWYLRAGAGFLDGYLEGAAGAPFLPSAEEEAQALLDCFLLDKAVYELGYELNNRPDWVRIPIQGILELLKAER